MLDDERTDITANSPAPNNDDVFWSPGNPHLVAPGLTVYLNNCGELVIRVLGLPWEDEAFIVVPQDIVPALSAKIQQVMEI
jgi:hypothetical protein